MAGSIDNSAFLKLTGKINETLKANGKNEISSSEAKNIFMMAKDQNNDSQIDMGELNHSLDKYTKEKYGNEDFLNKLSSTEEMAAAYEEIGMFDDNEGLSLNDLAEFNKVSYANSDTAAARPAANGQGSSFDVNLQAAKQQRSERAKASSDSVKPASIPEGASAEQLRSDRAQAMQDLSDARKAVDEAKDSQEVKDAQAKVDDAQAKYDEAVENNEDEAANELKEQKAETEAAIEGQENVINGLKNNIQSAEETVKEKEEAVSKADDAISQAESEISDLNSQLSGLKAPSESDFTKTDDDGNTVTDSDAFNGAQIQYEQQKASIEAKIEQAEAKKAEAEQQKADAEQQKAEAEDKLADLNSQLTEAEDTLAALQAEKEDIDNQIADTLSDDTAVQEAKAALDEAKSELETVKAEAANMTELEGNVAQLEENVAQYDAAIAEAEAKEAEENKEMPDSPFNDNDKLKEDEEGNKFVEVEDWDASKNDNNDCLAKIIANNYDLEALGIKPGSKEYQMLEKAVMDANEDIYGTEDKQGRNRIQDGERHSSLLYGSDKVKLPDIYEIKEMQDAGFKKPEANTGVDADGFKSNPDGTKSKVISSEVSGSNPCRTTVEEVYDKDGNKIGTKTTYENLTAGKAKSEKFVSAENGNETVKRYDSNGEFNGMTTTMKDAKGRTVETQFDKNAEVTGYKATSGSEYYSSMGDRTTTTESYDKNGNLVETRKVAENQKDKTKTVTVTDGKGNLKHEANYKDGIIQNGKENADENVKSGGGKKEPASSVYGANGQNLVLDSPEATYDSYVDAISWVSHEGNNAGNYNIIRDRIMNDNLYPEQKERLYALIDSIPKDTSGNSDSVYGKNNQDIVDESSEIYNGYVDKINFVATEYPDWNALRSDISKDNMSEDQKADLYTKIDNIIAARNED